MQMLLTDDTTVVCKGARDAEAALVHAIHVPQASYYIVCANVHGRSSRTRHVHHIQNLTPILSKCITSFIDVKIL